MSTSSVSIDRVVDCPFSSVVEYADGFVNDELGAGGGFELALHLPLSAQKIGLTRRVRVSTAITRDLTDFTRSHEAMWFELQPDEGVPPLPPVRVLLTVRPWSGMSKLQFAGSVLERRGRVGKLVETILVDQMARSLERRHAEFRRTTSIAAQVPEEVG
jgi:hypothetical protein